MINFKVNCELLSAILEGNTADHYQSGIDGTNIYTVLVKRVHPNDDAHISYIVGTYFDGAARLQNDQWFNSFEQASNFLLERAKANSSTASKV